MINSVVLVGRLTKDPELKYTQGGVAVCRFTLAVNRPFKNAQGENEADFVNCVTWRKQAENTANFLRKGSLTGLEGRIQTSNFEGKDGNRVFMTEIVADSVQFLEPKNNNSNNTPSNQSQSNQQQEYTYTQNQQQNTHNQSQGGYNVTQNNNGPIEVSDDDLPF
ncbi:single-stranded DNA-binding protein [Sporosarcina jiandibaonis]|uniref:single-stranded DNA-binding protein n=1 Tax=Sporosarcina jiandibaonis TaxID=2715535 RepID=UPI001557EEE2|nr:single-stranded DNA-binding protein [Sporosarcina jiandibaonis]